MKAQPATFPVDMTTIVLGVDYQDYIIPSNLRHIVITVTGGKGESSGAFVTSTCRRFGGRGAKISAKFLIGDYDCPTSNIVLKPGGTLRFIIGQAGHDVVNTNSIANEGSGGGGTAALYLAPGSSNWVILLVAGGGGGAARYTNNSNACTGFNGKDAELGESGGDGAGPNAGLGGSNGQGGQAGGIIAGDAGGGGGVLSPGTDGTRPGIGGKAGGSTGGNGGVFFTLDGSLILSGGYGFGGGGAAAIAGGGGGGYSGGGGGGLDGTDPGGGGGGGSYVIKGAADVVKTLNNDEAYGKAEIDPEPGFQSVVNERIYVDPLAIGLKNGTSWQHAFHNLQDALNKAGNTCQAEIWVKKGTYYPDEGNSYNDNDRSHSFKLKNGVSIYGGFAGNETELSQRDWFANPTYLSGDITQNDANGGNKLDNSYHVVVADGVGESVNINGSAVLDGFIITAGNANATNGTNGYGGGIFNRKASPNINNCEFRSNEAVYGGAFSNYEEASPIVVNCFFKGNFAREGGGAVYNSTFSSPYFYNSVFSGNFVFQFSGLGGGAVYNINNSTPEFINCSFSGNRAPSGGAIYNTQNSTINIYSSIIWNNLAAEILNTPSASVYNVPNSNANTGYFFSLVANYNLAGADGNLDGTLAANNPLFTTPIDAYTAPTIAGDLSLSANSPVIDKGSDGYTDYPTDIINNPRFVNNIDMGAYESRPCLQVQWILDDDGDDYYPGSPVTACTSPGDAYIVMTNEQPGDCNDNDPAINPGTIWILDADQDGFYGGSPVTGCTKPALAYIIKKDQQPGDCDDGDATITNIVIWCLDADNDGYYTGDPVTQCASPGPGYVMKIAQKPGDCNDNDETINPETIWYVDADHDGYYRTGIVYAASCTPPGPSFTLLNTKGPDCNDNDPAINPETIWVLDADKDGFYTGDPVTQCTSPGQGYVMKIEQKQGDCNDDDAAINPATIWYLDFDGDGYHNPLTIAFPSCTSPGQYYKLTTRGPDCNDDALFINPQTNWVLDSDLDSYYVGDPITSCTSPGAGYRIKLNQLAGDCDDNNSSINTPTGWYFDGDNDGYYNQQYVGLPSCTSPGEGWVNSTNGPDCNDGDNKINPETIWILDKDGDGYYADEATGCVQPGGYKIKSNEQPGDCNDNDANVHTSLLYYVDADKDGYGSAATAMLCSSAAPVGYSVNNTDCNDNNNAIHPGATEVCDGLDNNCNGQTDEGVKTTFYRDADTDGYGSPLVTTQACSAPAGYVSNNTDCDDTRTSVHPGAIEICDGLDNNCNGQTDEGVKTIFYRDADSDGYGNPLVTTQACSAPVGYVSGNTDCNDNINAIHPGATEVCDGIDNDCDGLIDEGVKTTFYRDADADGYGNAAISTQACSAPAGYVSNNTDCSDNDPTVNPGAVEVCGNGKDDNCNSVQNEQGCYTCGNATGFSTTNITSNSATLNWVSIPNPNYWQVQYKSTKPGSRWADVKPDPTGNKRSVQITGLSANQSYLWHIKARCNNSWTDYSVSIGFKMASSVVLTRPAPTTAEPEEIGEDKITVHPNPTTGMFNLKLQLKSMVSTTAEISLTDITGRTIYKQKAGVVSGLLNDQLQIPGDAAAGVYVIQVMVDGQPHQLKLVYVK